MVAAVIWEWFLDFGLQWLAVIFNLIYVVLAIRENIWCWFFGFVGVLLLFFIALQVSLYSDALLQIFYMVMSIYGWIHWRSASGTSRQVRRATATEHLRLLLAGSAATILLGLIFKPFGAALPFIDAFTSAFAIIATFMVAYKILENWIYWIVIDLVTAGVYWNRDLPPLSILFLGYTLLAVAGFITWKKNMINNLD